MASTDLQAIRLKVRRITKSPSQQQLSDAEIDEYVNTFLLYSFPEELRLQTLRTNYVFYTDPYIDTYNFDVDNFVSVEPPVYVGGYECWYTMSQTEMYRIYPKVAFVTQVATGDGVTTAYTFTLSATPVLRNQVTISAITAANAGIQANDDGNGLIVGDATGTINYVTGVVNLTFTSPPAASSAINAETVPYNPSRPVTVLFFQNQFILRPVPDQVYKVEIMAYENPVELIASGQSPELKAWWELIAIGASMKIFTDRREIEQYQQYKPLYDEQLMYAVRRTIQQQTSQRSSTIYTENSQWPRGNYFNNF